MKAVIVLSVCLASVYPLLSMSTDQPSQVSPSKSVGGTAPASAKTARGDEPAQPDAELAFPTITPMLMFSGKAEEAMKFYVSLFRNSQIMGVHRWLAGEPGGEGKIKHAMFSMDGQVFRCMDSAVKHDFTFTPSTSFFVNCTTEQQIDTLYAALSKDGKILTPLGKHPFAKKYAWVDDRFGVSWQLYLVDDHPEPK